MTSIFTILLNVVLATVFGACIFLIFALLYEAYYWIRAHFFPYRCPVCGAREFRPVPGWPKEMCGKCFYTKNY